MAKTTDPAQLYIFEQPKLSAEEIKQRLEDEDRNYEKRKQTLNSEIAATNAAIDDPDTPWQELSGYNTDLREAKRELEELEAQHLLNIANIKSGMIR